MLDLPDEIICEILKYLSYKMLKLLMIINKTWRNEIEDRYLCNVELGDKMRTIDQYGLKEYVESHDQNRGHVYSISKFFMYYYIENDNRTNIKYLLDNFDNLDKYNTKWMRHADTHSDEKTINWMIGEGFRYSGEPISRNLIADTRAIESIESRNEMTEGEKLKNWALHGEYWLIKQSVIRGCVIPPGISHYAVKGGNIGVVSFLKSENVHFSKKSKKLLRRMMGGVAEEKYQKLWDIIHNDDTSNIDPIYTR